MTKETLVLRSACGGFLLSVIAIMPAEAQRVSKDVEATVSGGYSSSPFLSGGGTSGSDDSGGAYVDLLLRPSIERTDGVQTMSASAYVRASHYFSDDYTSWSFGGVLSDQRQVSSRLSLHAHVQVDSLLPGERAAGFVVDPNLAPAAGISGTTGSSTSGLTADTVPVSTIPVTPSGAGGTAVPTVLSYPADVTLIGTRDRQTTFGGGIGGSYLVSTRDVTFFDIGAQRSRYGSTFSDFSTYNAALGYQRRLNAQMSVGLQLAGQYTDFSDGDGRAFTPQVTLSTSLSSSVTVRGAIGALFIQTDTVVSRRTQTGVSGNLNVCRTDERSRACLTVSRDATPTGLGAVSSDINAAANYSYRLNRSDSLSLAGSYSRVDNNTQIGGGGGGFSFASASARLSHLISRRVTVGAAFDYRRTFGEEVAATSRALDYNRVSDYGASIFLTAHTSQLK